MQEMEKQHDTREQIENAEQDSSNWNQIRYTTLITASTSI